MVFEIEWSDRTPSTNAYMKDRFTRDLGLPNGTIFATREQTAGRGIETILRPDLYLFHSNSAVFQPVSLTDWPSCYSHWSVRAE